MFSHTLTLTRAHTHTHIHTGEKDLDGLDKSVKGNSKLVGRLRAGGPVLQIPSSGGDDGARPPFVRGSGTVSGTIGVAALLADFAKANQKKAWFLGIIHGSNFIMFGSVSLEDGKKTGIICKKKVQAG
eukprot:1152332-Pelagomonas_calceolata.AAC.5